MRSTVPSRFLTSLLLLISSLCLWGCPPTTLKQLVEDHFSDFTGLTVALDREYIVGLQTAPDFSNFHCCWVGDRTGWQKTAGAWTSDQQTELAAGSLALFQDFSSEVSSDNVSYVEIKAESFFEDQLLNLRHFEREHCSNHSALPCSSEICTHALKLGRLSISTLTKLTRPVASTQSGNLETVELEGKPYARDSLSATDIIVGYRMASTLCGEQIAWGENRRPSSKLMEVEVDGISRIETYEDHFFRFQKKMEGRNQARTFEFRIPKEPPLILLPLQAQATALFGPPEDQVTSGRLIRVTTVNQTFQPSPAREGLLITEIDEQGATQTRQVQTDLSAGAWIMVGTEAKTLTAHLEGKEVYSRETRQAPGLSQRQPVIDVVTPFQSSGPKGMVESGSLARISGSHLGPATQLLIEGKSQVPLVAGTDHLVGFLEGVGPTRIAVRNGQGLTSPEKEITLVQISTEQVPPSFFKRGQKADIILRIEGTSDAIPLDFAIDSKAVHFLDGNRFTTTTSSGGDQNTARVTLHAQGAGPYRINFRLADPKKEAQPPPARISHRLS